MGEYSAVGSNADRQSADLGAVLYPDSHGVRADVQALYVCRNRADSAVVVRRGGNRQHRQELSEILSGVCLEGAIIVLACVICSLFASAPPSVNTGASAITQVWTYVGEIIFNMLVLVGTVKLSDQVVSKMLGI